MGVKNGWSEVVVLAFKVGLNGMNTRNGNGSVSLKSLAVALVDNKAKATLVRRGSDQGCEEISKFLIQHIEHSKTW